MKKHHKRKNSIGLDQGNFLGLFFFTFRDIKNVPKSIREQADYRKNSLYVDLENVENKGFYN